MQVTTRVDRTELADIDRSMRDIARAVGKSGNRRHKAAATEIAKLADRIPEAVGIGVGAPERPKLVCLCGSTRFYETFQDAGLNETLDGKIVLSIGAAVASDEEHFGHMSEEEKAALKVRLDELHLRKIDLADEVLVLNVDGYVGESTSREVAYAANHGKKLRYLEAQISEDSAKRLLDLGVIVAWLPVPELLFPELEALPVEQEPEAVEVAP